jgi:hypothetical protein
MFFITASNLWSLTLFAPLTYVIFIFSILFYCLPTLTNKTYSITTKTKSSFVKLNSFDIIPIAITPIVVLLIVFFLWSYSSTSAWFGHILYTNYQLKMGYFISVFFFFSFDCVIYLNLSHITRIIRLLHSSIQFFLLNISSVYCQFNLNNNIYYRSHISYNFSPYRYFHIFFYLLLQ